jgi:hypothetical protein
MKPPNPKRNGGPVSRTAACVKPNRPRPDKLGESVKASGRNDLEAAQANPRRIAQWFTHALCLTELAASNSRALEMLRVHLEAMREELA